MNLSFLTGQIEKIENLGSEDDSQKIIVQIVSVSKTRDKTKYDTHRLIAYGRVSSFVLSNFKIGDIVFVQARLQSRKNFDEAEVQYETEIVVWSIYRIQGNGS